MCGAKNVNKAQVGALEDNPSSRSPSDPFSKVSYIFNVAKIDEGKAGEHHINAETSHNLFHKKSSFSSYVNIDNNKIVHVENGCSRIYCEGKIKVQLGKKRVILLVIHALSLLLILCQSYLK